MKHVVVIGGAGFIGCHVVHHHLGQGDRVTIIDNLSRRGTDLNLHWLFKHRGDVTFCHGDIRIDNELLVSRLSDADLIYHLAAQVAVTTSVTDPRNDFEVNALGTFNVLEAARRSKRDPIFIYASTNKVYGGLEDLDVTCRNNRYELVNAPGGISVQRGLDFHSPYGCSKGTGDQYCRDYQRIFGLRTIVMRQSCIYGTRQFGIEDQGWLAHFVISILFNKPLTIYGDGMQVRDVLWYEDLLAAYLGAAAAIDRTAGKVYNVGGGPRQTLSLLETMSILRDEFGSEIPVTFADWRPGDQRVFVSDVSAAAADFGWQPRTTPQEGLHRLVEWARSNKDLLATVFHG